jgi:uncharacterized protein with HEPN domain
MSKRVDSVSLLDMLTYARKIAARLSGVSIAEWNSDETLRSAIAYWTQTIGEAATKVSKEFQKAHPEIDWARMSGMRNRIVHGYGLVDSDIVWSTAMNHIPALIRALERVVR